MIELHWPMTMATFVTDRQIKGHIGHVETQLLGSQCQVHAADFQCALEWLERPNVRSELSVLVWWDRRATPSVNSAQTRWEGVFRHSSCADQWQREPAVKTKDSS